MADRTYNWKRFWCPREGKLNLSDGGYLYDPEAEWGHIYNPDVVQFESIAMVPCLALLGEPGIGKTHAMQDERQAVDAKIEEEGDHAIRLNLRSYGSEDRLVSKLFESPTFSSWRKGTHRLHIFLDSLDESLLRIDTLSALLIDELQNYPTERLYLRIACRTADWPNGLEKGLRQIWGNDAVGVYELAPLRRLDVAEAARANDLDPEDFIHEIDSREAVPLAIKPVTLEFLLRAYRRDGKFPSTKAELYFKGCRLLCEETSESRRDARLTGILTADQRLAVASRIAAVTIFAKRYAIWTGIDQGDVLEEDIAVRELYGKSEPVNGDRFDVSDTAVRETLATGLFSSRGSHRLGWAHQTYAEFLAAQYLVQNEMAITQMMSLFIHPGDPEGKLVPQLHETAAWLAGMEPDVFRVIMNREPEVLLRSDVATADVADRAALVVALLKLLDEEKLLDRDWDLHRRYKKLAHPRLADQLQPYICDSAKGIVVRREAIDIAEACEIQELQSDFLDIVLDASQPSEIRTEAASALIRVGDDESKAKLKPLALGEAGDDPKDELKGCGLLATWPAHLAAEELFTVIIPPKEPSLSGMYTFFLSNELVPNLQATDLPLALEWVEGLPSRHEAPFTFMNVADEIMLFAWENLETPGVLEAFAKAALSKSEHYDELVGDESDTHFREMLINDDAKRRRVLEAIVLSISDPKEQALWLVYSRTPVALSKDVLWMVEKLKEASSEQSQRTWAELIGRVRDWNEPGQLDAVLIACKEDPILAENFSWLIKVVELDSPEAEQMRASYLKMKIRQERIQERPLLDPPPAERIELLLDQCESGNLAAWWQLNREMTLEPDSTHYRDELEPDLTALPGWKAAEALTRARIVEASKRYVLEQDPNTHEWLGTNTFHRPAFAGYRALLLLLKEEPSFVATIGAVVWKRWAPIIIAYPTSSGLGDEKPHHRLVNTAYQYAPEEIIETLITMIDKENKESDHISITRKIEDCWDNLIADALLTKVKDTELKPNCMGDLLSGLLDHRVDGAREFAESLIRLPLPNQGKGRERAIVAARVLMNHTEDGGWPVVWPAFQQDTEFGRQVVAEVANGPDGRDPSVGHRLKEDQLADLYIWLTDQYPHNEDPQHEGAYWVGPRDAVGMWRDALLQQLKMRGTPQACTAIRRIAHKLPELDWLKWTLLEAQSITRRGTWIPPRPVDILEIARAKEVRLVQSGDQLLEVIIESLKRFEAKLHGETPAIRTLWDRVRRNVYRPIDEDEFSDQVKIHLDEDLGQRGIIINREVRIHRGERTDIHVDAVIQSQDGEAFDSITVIIEVKGCWHQELNHAMEAQLLNRYMKDNRCQHGLYLVGWFNCELWDSKDYRKGRAPELSVDEAQQQFDAQADELSQQDTQIKAFVMDTALR